MHHGPEESLWSITLETKTGTINIMSFNCLMFSFSINDFHVRADPQHSLAYLKIKCAKNKRKIILVLASSWATLQENGLIFPGYQSIIYKRKLLRSLYLTQLCNLFNLPCHRRCSFWRSWFRTHIDAKTQHCENFVFLIIQTEIKSM